ncbi:MAG: ABC transporter substrate-binding protein [Rhodobacteraceae bacterium]|nr:ABC transporter substrate-binding protein [Paracoccaceae bacterium]
MSYLKQTTTLTRRSLLGTAAGAVAMSVLPGAGLKAQTPKRGGVLRYGCGHGATTDTLDLGLFDNDFTIALDYMLHNHIAELTADGDLVGEVAESWEAFSDAKEWVFRIRQGIEFHNGATVTAEDVVASVNYHRGEDSSSAAGALVKQITDIRAEGNNVIVQLTAGNADFPYILSDYHIPIIPSKDGKVVDAADGVGCGPYKLASFEPGVSAKVTRHENYWKSNAAFFDEIHMQALIDPTARTNSLLTGEIDLMNRAELKTVALLERNPNVVVSSISGGQHYTFPMLTNIAPFDNPHVRMALKLLAPRQDMVDKILSGHGSVGSDNPIGAAVPFAADLPQRPYDPDEAKFHLKQAGLETLGVSLHAADAAFSGAVDAATLYREAALPAGIDITVVREPNDGYWSDVWTQKPWCACYWGGRPTVDAMLSLAYVPGAAWNDTNWVNERFVELVTAGRAELDPGKRAEIYYEAQQLVSDDGGTVVPMFANYVYAASKKLAHGKLAANWDMDGQKFSERWWFA